MSILIDKSTRLIVQGITGRDGLFHAKKMKEYGTHVVGGTSPGKGGTDVDGIPVFNTMYDAVEQRKPILLSFLFRHVLRQMPLWRQQMRASG